MANKVIYAVYEDPEQLKDGARKLVSNGIKVKDVFSPFPVHGIDPIIGIKRTRWPSPPSCSASRAPALALLGIWYFNIFDWPMNIGGKPSQALYKNLPAFIPVTFEFTVLCARARHGHHLPDPQQDAARHAGPQPGPTQHGRQVHHRGAHRRQPRPQRRGHHRSLLRSTPVFEINERQY
jgi:hypothetical protein